MSHALFVLPFGVSQAIAETEVSAASTTLIFVIS